MQKKFSAIITKEDNWFVSFCPELGVASQGKTKKTALNNLKEAVELYLEEDPLKAPKSREVIEFTAKVPAYA
ncbi:MAG: type II toxin-antitoxin system HicB family antitoxin [Candidatus Diapherotrites archaeon]|nr:type II toxin-antitoxin system HicB family antitoxin [Candidatus Diapherotrites archaeon]